MHLLKIQVTGPLPPSHEWAVTNWKRKSYTRSHYMERIFHLPSQRVSFGGSFIGHEACLLPPLSHPRHLGLYSAHGLLVLGFRNNLGFTRYWPYAQTPAMPKGRWDASSSGFLPPTGLAWEALQVATLPRAQTIPWWITEPLKPRQHSSRSCSPQAEKCASAGVQSSCFPSNATYLTASQSLKLLTCS
jgi:hypothetical protein